MFEQLKLILADKYTSVELVDLLDIAAEDLIDVLEDHVMNAFSKDGALSSEWEDLNGNS